MLLLLPPPLVVYVVDGWGRHVWLIVVMVVFIVIV